MASPTPFWGKQSSQHRDALLMTQPDRPTWQLPPGVSRGTWDYVHAPHIADDYDDYFAFNSLFEFDEAVLAAVARPGLVADLGCGTGRALVPLVRAGHRGLASIVRAHAAHRAGEGDRGGARHRLRAGEPGRARRDRRRAVDYAMCMFSTLGMIRGRDQPRLRAGHTPGGS